jgi:hypothetical protein
MIVILAWVSLALYAASLLISPFTIGKPRRPYSAANYIGEILGAAITAVICGRILLWW